MLAFLCLAALGLLAETANELSDLAMWSLLVGFIAPLLIAVLQQPQWTRATRALVTFVFCIVVGLGTAYFNGDFNGRSIVSSVLIVLVTAISTHSALFKNIGLTDSIEKKTSPGNPAG